MRATVCERLAEWICAVRLGDIPESVLEKARSQIASVMAALHAGAATEEAAIVRRAVTRWNKPGPCTVIPTGERLALHEAILANSAASMALDYDDYLFLGHTGHSAVLASWALCEQLRRGPADLLLAQVIANEIGGRVGASSVLGPQNGQTWSFLHAAAGAAATAKLCGLDRAQTAHALAIALYQPPFTLWPGFMGPGSKLLTAGWPTVTGVQAAQFAEEGLTGAREIFEHPRQGFWSVFTFAALPHLLEDLGKDWVTETLVFKRYPGCAYLDTSLDALFGLLDGHRARAGRRLRPDEVDQVLVDANLLTVEMDNLSSEHPEEPLSAVRINFSIPMSVAIGIAAGRLTAAELSSRFLAENDRVLRDLAARVVLRHDWGMTLRLAESFEPFLRTGSGERALGARELLRVVRGYHRQMGGPKRTPLGPASLILGHGRDLLRVVGRAARGARRPAGGRRFASFAMRFPARVTLRTRAGEILCAESEIPRGAPGQDGYFETVEEKFRTEVGAHLDRTRVEEALAMLRRLEEHRLEEVTARLCW